MKAAPLLLSLSLLPFLACGGNGTVLDAVRPAIHGQVARIWRNGTVLTSYGLAGSDVQAYGLALQGTDLYWVATRWSGTQSWILLGKNAGSPATLAGGARPAEGYAVAVSGPDVYVGGFEASGGTDAAPVPVAKVWRNGTATSLSGGVYEAKVNGLAVAGGQAYAAGYEFVPPAPGVAAQKRATVWEGATAVRLTDGTQPAEAWAVAVDESGGGLATVYAGGWLQQGGNRVATVWKNGAALYTLADPANQSVVTGLLLSGGALYASGYETVAGVPVARIWKDGAVYQTLGDGAVPSVATGLALVGTDLLASGSRGPAATRTATLWWNGTAQPALSDGTTAAEAAAVATSGPDIYLAGYVTAP